MVGWLKMKTSRAVVLIRLHHLSSEKVRHVLASGRNRKIWRHSGVCPWSRRNGYLYNKEVQNTAFESKYAFIFKVFFVVTVGLNRVLLFIVIQLRSYLSILMSPGIELI